MVGIAAFLSTPNFGATMTSNGCTLSESIRWMEAGRQHWIGVEAGTVKPEMPEEYAEPGAKFTWFVKGAREEIEKSERRENWYSRDMDDTP